MMKGCQSLLEKEKLSPAYYTYLFLSIFKITLPLGLVIIKAVYFKVPQTSSRTVAPPNARNVVAGGVIVNSVSSLLIAYCRLR